MDEILETLWIAIDESPDVLENYGFSVNKKKIESRMRKHPYYDHYLYKKALEDIYNYVDEGVLYDKYSEEGKSLVEGIRQYLYFLCQSYNMKEDDVEEIVYDDDYIFSLKDAIDEEFII